MATTKIRSSSILDGQVSIADIVGGGADSRPAPAARCSRLDAVRGHGHGWQCSAVLADRLG